MNKTIILCFVMTFFHFSTAFSKTANNIQEAISYHKEQCQKATDEKTKQRECGIYTTLSAAYLALSVNNDHTVSQYQK
jgi:hypothetical protein